MKAWCVVLIFFGAATFAADPAPATPRPKKQITVCQPYAEKCPACADCSRCRACSKDGNRCSVRRAQLGFAPADRQLFCRRFCAR